MLRPKISDGCGKMLFFPVSALLSIRCLCLISVLLGVLCFPFASPSHMSLLPCLLRKPLLGCSPPQPIPETFHPPFSFIVSFFFPSSSRNEMRRIRQWRRSTERCVSTGAPLENTGAAGSFGPNQGLIGGWGGGQLAEFVASEFARSELWLSAYPTIWRKQRLS